jgi:malonyl CoA-acyl carrier protein transacylase
MKNMDVIATLPSGLVSTDVAIAASRAGARGFIRLHTDDTAAEWGESVQRLIRFTGQAFGVVVDYRCASPAPDFPAPDFPVLDILGRDILPQCRGQLKWVWLEGDPLERWSPTIAALKELGLEVFVTATQLEEFAVAQRIGTDHVILRGNESGGSVGEATTMVLVQHWQRFRDTQAESDVPRAWAQGGVGPNTAAACRVAGVDGLVVDSQLLLAKEAALTAGERRYVESFDGSLSRYLGGQLGVGHRITFQPGSRLGEELGAIADRLAAAGRPCEEVQREWCSQLRAAIANDSDWRLHWIGQDASFAKGLAKSYITVGGIIQAICRGAEENIRLAHQHQPLASESPLATSHGTHYPILQGPMTRVSDTAEFTRCVAEDGGLPFLALALMRGPETKVLLEETRDLLGSRPWGVGLLGFLPPEIRQEQIKAIKSVQPPLALIAGGRPDQARELEAQGIPTYLHVPSPGLMRMFLRDGATRFIFEGRECGGHVGPRTSFVLWETAVNVFLEHLGPSSRGDQLHVVFAGGIHDAVSAAMVAAIAAPLVQRGVKIGVLMGTAYLFTEQAVASGSIVPRFQDEALKTDNTVLFETGPGHAIRCLPTPYFDDFQEQKAQLRDSGKTHEEIVKALEWMNIGRLRVASKGLERTSHSSGGLRNLESVSDDQQYQRGMYMIGQVASMHDKVTTIAELHGQVSQGGTAVIATVADEIRRRTPAKAAEPKPCDVAIVGMACNYPGATNMRQYWENILQRKEAITEVPRDTHWDWTLYYDPDPLARDRIISKWGGFLDDVPFDSFRYGIAPRSVPVIEPLQLLLLEAVRLALDDAGYTHRPFDRERTAAILGIGGGGSPMGVAYGFRSCLPLIDSVEGAPCSSAEVMKACEDLMPEWTEDSFPGFLMNVAVGRVANRFNFGGSNYAIDAACASSLSAVHACIRELEQGTTDLAVAMGADTVQTPYSYMAFSKTHALSARGKCSPFDAEADGIVLSEGIGAVILKRLEDAKRDGDQIYAVIRGIGSSSDGKDKGLTAPNAAGQLRALRRAYDKAGISPARVELIEAHGTGTVVGDRTESLALTTVMQESGADLQSCALGSVKSMIGHSKCAAGIAGLIKTALSLHHKVLPPTLVNQPDPTAKFEESALYLNTHPRPWVHGHQRPRCAGVSAFGFGGTNVHVVLEEYADDFALANSQPTTYQWPTELFVWRAADRDQLREQVAKQLADLQAGARPEPADYAASLWNVASRSPASCTLGIVAGGIDELVAKMQTALDEIAAGKSHMAAPSGIYFSAEAESHDGKVAVLFPGQGSQYPNMLGQLAIQFDEVREAFDNATTTLQDCLESPLGRYVYPRSTFTDEEKNRVATELARTDVAQPAIGAASVGLYRLLSRCGLNAGMVAGHSYGEYVALWCAGAITAEQLTKLSHRRGQLILEAAGDRTGGMAAVAADDVTVKNLLQDGHEVVLANLNAPNQTVIAGPIEALEKAVSYLSSQGLRAKRLDVSCAFHSPWIADAADPLAESLQACPFQTTNIPVYANSTAEPYPCESEQAKQLLIEQLVSPVRFREQIIAMYEDGARIFVEVGPQNHLTGLVKRILGDQSHVAISTDKPSRDGLTQLQHTLARLMVEGVDLTLEPLFAERVTNTFDPKSLVHASRPPELSKSTWLVNGVRSRLWNAPEPRLLGQRRRKTDSTLDDSTLDDSALDDSALDDSALDDSTLDDFTLEGGEAVAPPNGKRQVANSSRDRSQANTPLKSHPDQAVASRNQQQEEKPPKMTTVSSNGSHGVDVRHSSRLVTEQPNLLPGPGVDPVMLGFQQLMSQFLETQQSIMLQYLDGSVASLSDAPPIAPLAPARVVPASRGPMVVEEPMTVIPASAPEAPPNGSPQPSPVPDSPVQENVVAESRLDETSDASPSGLNMQSVAENLMNLVSQRTGYPPEMLDLDLDLEADLGIDSIKRVEILGELAELLGTMDSESSELELERLTTIRNLRGILEYLEDTIFGEPADEKPSAAESVSAESVSGESNSRDANLLAAPLGESGLVEIQRGLVRLIESPMPTGTSMLIPNGAVLISDDGRGIASLVAERLADFGQTVALVRPANQTEATFVEGVFQADLSDERSVKSLVDLVRSEVGSIAGLIHLATLADVDPQQTRVAQVARDTKSLYLLARHFEADFAEAAQSGSAFLLTPTGLGGHLGYDDAPATALERVGNGGILGFSKCLAIEWPEMMVRTVDVDPSLAEEDIAEILLGEVADPEGPIEVGYCGNLRVTWAPISANFEAASAGTAPLDGQSVVLVTGGARGISSAIAVEIAKRYQSRLVLVGRSEPPTEREPDYLKGISDASELKSVLISKLANNGSPATPGEIEVTYRRILRDREIKANLAAICEAGSQVEYLSLDVRDEIAVQELLDYIYEHYGRIDGVIHGAGVIEDKLVRDKTSDSFDRVFSTKVNSALHLAKHLRPDQLKFCAFFASVASRYGNRGQADYAAANEVLSKLAAILDRAWPARVFSVAWGPWSEIGMVSDLAKHFRARGVSLIEPAVGVEHFLNEIIHGQAGDREVIIAGGAGRLVEPTHSREAVV